MRFNVVCRQEVDGMESYGGLVGENLVIHDLVREKYRGKVHTYSYLGQVEM